MSLKTFIVPHIASRILSRKQLDKQRAKFESKRLKYASDHIVEFFHYPLDPYSNLLKAVLPEFRNRYDIKIITHFVSPPKESAVPERDKLIEYSKIDAFRLAKEAKLSFPRQEAQQTFDTKPGDARLEKLGHYLGGTLYYGGEWYWGLDRLHYLESRLTDLKLRRASQSETFFYEPRPVPASHGKTHAELHWYLSFRSPYTAIVAQRVKALADAYGATLKLRFVLPMVMRDLPVPKIKSQYIVKDAAREAHRLQIPFGRICDPVGRPVERGYSLLPWAIEQGRGFEFTSSFLSKVWSQGVDAGNDKGMKNIVEGAGLDWHAARHVLGNEAWREQAEANRQEMMAKGIWGVPSFRVNDTITWGQDRLWVIEDALKTLTDQ